MKQISGMHLNAIKKSYTVYMHDISLVEISFVGKIIEVFSLSEISWHLIISF